MKKTFLATFQKLPIKKKEEIYIPESITTSFPVKECGEKLISIEKAFQNESIAISIDPPKDLLPAPTDIFLRKTALQFLLHAARKLPPSVIFKISEGYRSLTYQAKIFNDVLKEIREKNPLFSSTELYEEVTKYVADPTLCPPHTTGGAIDILLATPDGQMLDMGCAINTSDAIATTFYKHISKQAKKNRMLLFNVLTGVGFVNLPTEYWHFSYGDQYWAIFKNKKYAIYNKI